jgi:Polyketide cyclase / dehydrase and lipid transport
MTINVSDSVVIVRPVSEVFAFVADHENLPAWTVGVKEARRLTEGRPASGSRYRVVGRLLGRSIESSYLVTGFEPGRGFEGTMTSPMFGFSERYGVESAGDGTRVSMSATVEPHGLFRLLGPVLAAGARRQVKADHRHLKTVLERPMPVADPGR